MEEGNIISGNGSGNVSLSLVEANEEPDLIIFELVIPGIMLSLVGMLGLIGNLLAVFILSRPQMKGSTNCILMGLASSDSILILTRYITL